MAWRDYYYKLTIPIYFTFFIFTPLEKKEFFLLTVFISLIYYTIHGFSCVFPFSLLPFILMTFLYLWVLLRWIYFRDITVYLNKKKYSLGLNQEALYKTYNKSQKSTLFFLNVKKNNCSKDSEEKLAFIEAQKKYLFYMRETYPLLAIYIGIGKVFLLTFFVFWSLIYFIDTASTIEHPNFLFLVSTILIIRILIQGYQTAFVDKYAKIYYFQLTKKLYEKKKCLKIDFNITHANNVKKENNFTENRMSIDITGIIIGVLFSLYVTLLFNKIYPTQIVVNKNIIQDIYKITQEKRE